MKAQPNVGGETELMQPEDDGAPLAMDAVYDALRSCLPQLREHDLAVAEIGAALELCAMMGDREAGELLSEIRAGR